MGASQSLGPLHTSKEELSKWTFVKPCMLAGQGGVREMQSIPGLSLGLYSHPLLCPQDHPSPPPPTLPQPPRPQPSPLGAEITPSPLVEIYLVGPGEEREEALVRGNA